MGGHLINHLLDTGEEVTALSRNAPASSQPDISWRALPDLASGDVDPSLFEGQDVVIHCAARVHIMEDSAQDPLREYRAINRDGTLVLAKAAAIAGVEQFIFVSSIKVNGEETDPGRPFHPDDSPVPSDPYGISKMEAENGLREIASDTGMRIAIVRPVLVYGHGVGANFLAISKLAARGLPLPFKAIDNRRSLVYVGNLVDLLRKIAIGAIGERTVYLASDPRTVSIGELVLMLAQAQNVEARLFRLPTDLMKGVAGLLGKREAAQRLFGSLEVDHQHLEDAGWKAPFTMEEGFSRTFASAADRP